MTNSLDLVTSPVVLVRGPARSGKTMFLSWLAEEAFHERRHVIVVSDGELLDRIEQFCPRILETNALTHVRPDSFIEVKEIVSRAPLDSLVLIDDFAYLGPYEGSNTLQGTMASRLLRLQTLAGSRCQVVAAVQGILPLSGFDSINLKSSVRD